MRVLIGCEQFGHMREAFRRRGHDAWSCDLEPARDNSPHHLQCDVLTVLDDGWDLGIFHPDCTYLTCSAEWAYKDPDFERYPGIGYHQKVKPGTLVGEARRQAREEAVAFVFRLRDSKIPRKAIENPVGVLSSRWRRANQTVQPNWFGDDASKATCWWLEGGLMPLTPTKMVAPRIVNGKPRWSNQTDGGQNKLPPSTDRAMLRAETYPGLAEACALQWGCGKDFKDTFSAEAVLLHAFWGKKFYDVAFHENQIDQLETPNTSAVTSGVSDMTKNRKSKP